jgi:hypothetical protein
MDDVYCLFVTFTCLLTLAIPTVGQPILAVFAFTLAVLARLAPHTEGPGHRTGTDRHNLAGR